MIYEVEVAQTVKGKIFIKADSQKETEEAANRYIRDEQNIGSINFDEIGTIISGTCQRQILSAM